MNIKIMTTKTAIFLAAILMSVSAYSLDTDEDADDPKDSTSETEDAAAESGAAFDPPHDEHINNTKPVDTHATGASASDGASLAEAATDPSAILTQFQNFFWTTSTSDNKNIANTYLFQAVLPMSKSNVLRPAIPLVNTGGPNGKFGMGDLFLLDIEIRHAKTGAWGFGVAGNIPTATNKQIGAGKWTAGPTLLYMNKTHPKDLLGVLAYNLWSYAGDSDRDSVNTFNFQPIWVHHTAWGYWGWTDQLAIIDWEHDNNLTLPVGLRFGTVWQAKTPLKTEIGFYYNVTNNDRDSTFGVKFTASFIKPHMLNH